MNIPRLSNTEVIILELLANSTGKMFGLEMIRESEGKLKKGTIYVMLSRMEEKGLIKSDVEPRTAPEIGIPRRFYELTGHGARALAAYEAARESFYRETFAVRG